MQTNKQPNKIEAFVIVIAILESNDSSHGLYIDLRERLSLSLPREVKNLSSWNSRARSDCDY